MAYYWSLINRFTLESAYFLVLTHTSSGYYHWFICFRSKRPKAFAQLLPDSFNFLWSLTLLFKNARNFYQLTIGCLLYQLWLLFCRQKIHGKKMKVLLVIIVVMVLSLTSINCETGKSVWYIYERALEKTSLMEKLLIFRISAEFCTRQSKIY